MRIFALLLLLVASPAFAQDSPLVGSWKLVNYKFIFDNDPPTELFGARPNGVLILTREGRMVGLVTAETRKAGTGDAERAGALQDVGRLQRQVSRRGQRVRYHC